MNEYVDIILEALRDFRNWYVGQGGDTEELKADKEKVKKINAAIDYIEKTALNGN